MNRKKLSLDRGDDDDFEFDFDSPLRKPIIRKGRRSESALSSTNSSIQRSDTAQSTGTASPPDPTVAVVPPTRSKKNGGWAEHSTTSKMNWLRRMSKSSPSKDSSKWETKTSQDSDGETPSIPDLDDVYQEEFSAQIAEAPNIAIHKVLTYQELDNDLTKNAAFQTLDGIDLRLLTKYLGSEHKINEDESPWIWDMLFTDVSSYLIENDKESDSKAVLAENVKSIQ